MDQPNNRNAYDLAVHHGIDFWPPPCPLCGDDTPDGRPLDMHPGDYGYAIYRCGNCQTGFSRSAFLVAHAVRVAR